MCYLLKQKPTIGQTLLSVLAAMFGVQSAKKYHQDFTQGNPWAYVLLGLVLVGVFILILCCIVSLVIRLSK